MPIVVSAKNEVTRMATNNSGYFYNPKEKPPCNGECHERSQTCHSECKKYIDWKNKYEAQRKAIFEYDNGFANFHRFITGQNDVKVKISLIKKVCDVICKPFEEVFQERRNEDV